MLAAAQGPKARSTAPRHHHGVGVSEDRFSGHGISLENKLADYLRGSSSPLQRLTEIPFEVGNIELQKLGVKPRHQAVEVCGGRNQPGFAGAISQPARLIFKSPVAFQNGKDLHLLGRAAESCRVANAQFLKSEETAGENESARAVLLLAFDPWQVAQGRELRTNNLKPFI